MQDDQTSPVSASRPAAQISRHHRWNFFTLAIHQVLFDVGWVFKTEAIIIPAYVASLTASPALLSFFPFISRIGKFLPQLPTAVFTEHSSKRKYPLVVISLGLALPWALAAAGCWLNVPDRNLLLWIFLLMYGTFWLSLGAASVAMPALVGKIIRYNVRGRLMRLAGSYNLALTTLAAAGAGYVLSGSPPFTYPYNFATLFTATFILFSGTFVLTIMVREPRRPPVDATRRQRVMTAGGILALLRESPNLRRLVVIGWTFSLSEGMYPFYTMYAVRDLGLSMGYLSAGLIILSLAQSTGSILFGPLADRRGNRRALVTSVWIGLCIPVMPLIASVFAHQAIAGPLFMMTYAVIGFSLGKDKFMQNYLLETAPVEKQASYISAINMAVAPSCFIPLLVGQALKSLPYQAVFAVSILLLSVGLAAAHSLREPRTQKNTSV